MVRLHSRCSAVATGRKVRRPCSP